MQSTMSFSRACELIFKMDKRENEEAKILIEEENLYNQRDISRNRLLHYAAKVGNHEIVQFLVDSCRATINVYNDLTQTPLIANLESDFPCKKIIEILLKAGANISLPEYGDQSALHIVNSYAWLNENIDRFEIYKVFLENANDFFLDFMLLETGNENAIKMLLQTNIDLSITDSKGTTLVHALASNWNPGIASLLRGKIFDVNSRNENGWTPLMVGALYGSCSFIRFLLDEGADIEATDVLNRTALCFALLRFNLDQDNHKCIQLLLERGANVQIEITSIPYYTIFDLVLAQRQFTAGELMLSHLALQDARGTAIRQLILCKIESNTRLKNFYRHCKQQLSIKIYRSVTLFDVLTVSERKIEQYLRDKIFASSLQVFKTVDYYNTLLRKRVSKAISMIELRSAASSVVDKLIKIDYDCYPFVVDEIVSYLEKEDIKCLLSIESELCY